MYITVCITKLFMLIIQLMIAAERKYKKMTWVILKRKKRNSVRSWCETTLKRKQKFLKCVLQRLGKFFHPVQNNITNETSLFNKMKFEIRGRYFRKRILSNSRLQLGRYSNCFLQTCLYIYYIVQFIFKIHNTGEKSSSTILQIRENTSYFFFTILYVIYRLLNILHMKLKFILNKKRIIKKTHFCKC